MRKLLIFGLLLLIFTCSLFVAGYYVMFDFPFSGTYTKAVCNENKCQDFTFTCLNNHIIGSKAISGLVIFDEDWVDTRNTENKC